MDLCRACLHVSRDLQPLCSPQFEWFAMLTSIEIKPSDAQPQYLCSFCVGKLIDFQHFREMCIASDRQIRNQHSPYPIDPIDPIIIKPETLDADIDIAVKAEPIQIIDTPAFISKIDDDDPNDVETSDEDSKYDPPADGNNDVEDDDDDDVPLSVSLKPKRKPSAAKKSPSKKLISNSKPSGASSADQPKRERMECDVCGKTFFKRERIEAHILHHFGLLPYNCLDCHASFRQVWTLRTHQRKLHPERIVEGDDPPDERPPPRYTCTTADCSKSYVHRTSLVKHIQREHNGGGPELPRLMCESCGQTFDSSTALAEHMYRHRDPSTYPFACTLCPKRFTNKIALRTHTYRHQNYRPFPCTMCELRCYTKGELRVHMDYHNKELSVQCKECPNKFTTRMGLRRHMRRVHVGHRPYICPHCNRAFGKKESLRNHVMRHTGEKPFACQICGHRFIQQQTLKTHMKVHNKKPAAVTATPAAAVAAPPPSIEQTVCGNSGFVHTAAMN